MTRGKRVKQLRAVVRFSGTVFTLLNVITGTAGALARNAPQGAMFLGSTKTKDGYSRSALIAGEVARGPSKKWLGRFQIELLPSESAGSFFKCSSFQMPEFECFRRRIAMTRAVKIIVTSADSRQN